MDLLALGVGGQETTGVLAAVGDAVGADVDASHFQSVSVQLSGTHTGTVVFEVSNNGVDWVSKSLVSASGSAASSATANGLWSGDIGAKLFRARRSVQTTGSVNVTIEFSAASQFNTTSTQAVSGSVTANTVNSEQVESSTNLGASATYTGASRDLGSSASSRPTVIRPIVMHNAGLNPGMLTLEESTDGTTWRETRRVPIPSDGSFRTFEWPIHQRYYRQKFINGATAQTAFYLAAQRLQGEVGSLDAKANLQYLLSTTALGASATFTGPTLDLGDNHSWDSVRLRVHTDKAAATDGIRIETSHDGTNWGYTQAAAVAKAADNFVVAVERPITERYLRCVVANGAAAQTFLRVSMALISL